MADAPTVAPPADPTQPAAASTPVPKPEASKSPSKSNPYFWGTGRRKTAVARVRIRPGSGKFMVNKRDVNDFFKIDKDRSSVRVPLAVTETAKDMDVFVNVRGGGISGQSGAVTLGLARALAAANPDYEPALRAKHLLTRDPRKVERKKYGRAGARKRFQFSKR